MNNIESRMIKNSERRNKKCNRYHFKEFSTPHIALYPLMVICWYCDQLSNKISNLFYSLIKWTEKRAKRIITEAIVLNGELKDNKIAYYYRTWGVRWYDKYHCHLKDYFFCRKFNDKILEYFINDYELEGYTKEVEYDGDWYNFTFTKEND